MKPPYAIGSVPSLLGHAVAYRWRSLPRVHRHRASKPQGSSERVLPWQITMDQLIFAPLSHTHYWYEVGMLKVPTKYRLYADVCCCCLRRNVGKNIYVETNNIHLGLSLKVTITRKEAFLSLKKNQNTPGPSEHPPVMGENMSKRLGGIKRLQIQNLFMAFKQVPRCR